MRYFRMLLKALLALVLFALVLIGAGIGWFAYQWRTIDRVYATYDELMSEKRFSLLLQMRKWVPENARDIHCRSTAALGSGTATFSCRMTEQAFRQFAREMSYALATNAFCKLDYGESYDQSGGECRERWYEEMAETDRARQGKLVFGERPVPESFLSCTESHAFDGCHAERVYRRILVYDLKDGVLYGYAWRNLL